VKTTFPSLRPGAAALSALLGATSLAHAQGAPSSPTPPGSPAPVGPAPSPSPAPASPSTAPASPAAPADASVPASATHTAHPAELEPTLHPLVPTGTHANVEQPPDPAAPPVSAYPPSLPAPPDPFGTRGTIAITGAFTLGTSYTGSLESSDESEFDLRVLPGLDYFVAENLSLGGALILDYQNRTYASGMKVTSTILGAEVGMGYNVAFSRLFSWWPNARIGFGWSHTTSDLRELLNGLSVPVDTSSDDHIIVARAYLPFLIHPAQHFFVGIGPDGFIDLVRGGDSNADQRFNIALTSMVGGWF
jgi:hypothetical protein